MSTPGRYLRSKLNSLRRMAQRCIPTPDTFFNNKHKFFVGRKVGKRDGPIGGQFPGNLIQGSEISGNFRKFPEISLPIGNFRQFGGPAAGSGRSVSGGIAAAPGAPPGTAAGAIILNGARRRSPRGRRGRRGRRGGSWERGRRSRPGRRRAGASGPATWAAPSISSGRTSCPAPAAGPRSGRGTRRASNRAARRRRRSST